MYALSFPLDLIAVTLIPGHGPAHRARRSPRPRALVFSNALRLWLVWRFVKIQPYDRNYARLLIPTAVGGAA